MFQPLSNDHKKYQSAILVLLVIIFSFLVRVWQLDKNPAGFFSDEAVGGYEAWSLIHLGYDSNRDKFPLFFKGLNLDNLSPFNTYLPLPFIAIFGLNEFAVRLTAVTFSIIQIFIFYLTLKQIIPFKFAILGTIILSISPWHFHLSRVHINDYYAWILLVNLATLFLLKGYKTDKKNYYALAGLSLGLASYSYFPSRFISPILFLGLILIILFKKSFKAAIISSSIFLLVLAPFILVHLTDSNSFRRLRETIMQSRPTQENINPYASFTKKYSLHFSDDFLFEKGDSDFPNQFIHRHSIAGLGLLYPFQKWLIILGLAWALFQVYRKRDYAIAFVVLILLISPIPDSLTSDPTPFATRSYLEILPLSIFSSFGIFASFLLINKLKLQFNVLLKLIFYLMMIFLIMGSTINLLDKFTKNPLTTSDFWGWQYGPREVMEYFLSQKDNYDYLYMSGEFNGSEIFLKFYDPENHCQNKCKVGDFYRQLEIYNPQRRQVFSLSPEYLEKSSFKDKFNVKYTLYYPNGKVAFLIGEVIK